MREKASDKYGYILWMPEPIPRDLQKIVFINVNSMVTIAEVLDVE